MLEKSQTGEKKSNKLQDNLIKDYLGTLASDYIRGEKLQEREREQR